MRKDLLFHSSKYNWVESTGIMASGTPDRKSALASGISLAMLYSGSGP